MTLIAHVSDLHFGKEIMNRTAALKKQFETISPDLIVITGDLTQRATLRQYRSARQFLQCLHFDHIAVPGNHDLPLHRLYERFKHPWKQWNRFIGASTEPIYRSTNLLVTGLNTVSPMGHKLNWSRGRITKKRLLQGISGIDTDGTQMVKVVALHHPLWLPERYRYRKTAGNSKLALKTFREGGVDLVLSGHIHTGFVKLKSGTILCGSGSAVSNRLKTGQKNEFNIISVNRYMIEIQNMVWETSDFQAAGKQRFKKDGKDWRLTHKQF